MAYTKTHEGMREQKSAIIWGCTYTREAEIGLSLDPSKSKDKGHQKRCEDVIFDKKKRRVPIICTHNFISYKI